MGTCLGSTARAACATLALCTACTTTVTSSPAGLDQTVVARSPAARAFEVYAQGRKVGLVVRYEEPRRDGRIWYGVRNEHEQELGVVDREGRAWRYRPHCTEPEWVGTGTVLEGARRILDLPADTTLLEVRIEDLRADAPR